MSGSPTRRLHLMELGPAELPEFARQVLELADAGPASLHASHSLRGLNVEARLHNPAYRNLCNRALVNDEFYASAGQEHVFVSLLDASRSPELAGRRWAAERFEGCEMVAALEGNGLFGGFNPSRGLWQFYDPRDRRGVQLSMTHAAHPLREEAFPLQHFLRWAYQPLGMRLVRAGAVGRDGRGLLVAGATGAGKSATVLAGLCEGMTTTGDDHVVVEMTSLGIQAYPILRVIRQDAAGLARLGLVPEELGAIGPAWGGRYEFDVTAFGYDRLAHSLEIAGIVLPRISDGERAGLIPASPEEAVEALTPPRPSHLACGKAAEARFIAECAGSVPVHWLDIGPDTRAAARRLDEHLSGLP